METSEGAVNEEVSVSGTKVCVTTIGGSITGTTMSLTIDPKLSVTDFKLLVQDKADTTPEQRGPSRRASRKGVTSEFVRVFLDGHELGDEDATLETCGVKEDSVFFFAVGKTMGNKLRRAMRTIGEDFAEVGDGEILAAVLRDLKERMLGGDPKGTQLLDQLYDIFDTDFGDFEGVHEGYLTPFNAAGENSGHIQWLVEEKVEASFPFKTFFGIPVYTRLYGRQEQRIVGQAHPRQLVTALGPASTGYFGGATGQRMACVAHFAGPVGTAVRLDAGGAQVGQTVVSNGRDDFAVVTNLNE